MDQSDIENVFARLSAHEFLIEVLLARDLAKASAEEADAGIDKLRDLASKIYISGDASSDEKEALGRLAMLVESMTGNLLDKARIRASQIRSAQPPEE